MPIGNQHRNITEGGRALELSAAEAGAEYRAAIAASDEALLLAPDDIAAHNNKGNALRSLGELQAGLSRNDAALESYHSAMVAYDKALLLAPDDVASNDNKGDALLSLGHLQAGLSRNDDALKSYHSAIAAYDKALLLAPDFVDAHNNKAIALWSLGKLLLLKTAERNDEATRRQQGCAALYAAVAAYERALQLAPGMSKASAGQQYARELIARYCTNPAGPPPEGKNTKGW